MVITTTVLSTTPIQTINFKKSETNVSAATKKEVQSPRIIEDNYSDSSFTFVQTLIKCIISSFYMCFVIDYPHNPIRS